MNIESEVKSILRMDFKLDDKIRLITRFTNFKPEDITKAVKRKYYEKTDEIYRELLNLDKR